jgi:peptidoglycan-N-acetylmuramic acid deacetylase
MKKTTMNAALIIMLSATLAGCAGSTGSMPKLTISGDSPSFTPAPSPTAAASTPSPTPSPIPSATVKTSPDVTDSPKPIPSEKPTPSSTTAPKKESEPKKATGDRTPISWFYMKKKAGQVPDFPKETKSFTADQKAVWVGKGKTVYLTIDAGGPLIDVDLMLKSLKDNQVKANFFISGNNIKKNPDYLKRLVADGHFIANHTMTHSDFNELTDDQIKKEITDFENLYKNITGKDVEKFFRFPYGRYNMHALSLVSGMGYTSVFWSTAMRDWEPRKNGAEDPYNDIINNLHDGNIILMHQGSKENMEALDRICKAIKKAGYEFGTVNEL